MEGGRIRGCVYGFFCVFIYLGLFACFFEFVLTIVVRFRRWRRRLSRRIVSIFCRSS